MNKYLIVNADDFGYSRGTNYGILDSFQQGILTSATLMANTPGFMHAVEIAKEQPNLGVGIHLNLTFGKPLGKGYKKITDLSGNFPALSPTATSHLVVDEKETETELRLQIERVLEANIRPTHLDSHHHFHKEKVATKLVCKLAKEYNLPLRWGYPDLDFLEDVSHTGQLILDFDFKIMEIMKQPKEIWNELLLQYIQRIIEVIKSNKYLYTEIMSHPAYIDKYLYDHTSMDKVRAFETAALCHPMIPKMLQKNDIHLVNYQSLKLNGSPQK
jgi:predicted glycoside hydrolase/deacetylase ChbG (UPF0249 family)